jgi:hypothetical protein
VNPKREVENYALTDDALNDIVAALRQQIAIGRPRTTAEVRDKLLAVIDRRLDKYGVDDERQRLGLAVDLLVDLLATAVQRLAADRS